MTRITRFAARDSGPAARLAEFMAHLRAHGFRLGVAETETALQALQVVGTAEFRVVKLALKAVCAGCAEDAVRFDDLFDSYWQNGGRVLQQVMPREPRALPKHTRSSRSEFGPEVGSGGTPQAPANGEGGAEAGGEGRLVASTVRNLTKTDLREIVSPEDVRAAEAVARRLGDAIRDRRSRRRRAARRGAALDLRRTLRLSLSTGGVPMRLARRAKPDRPMKIVALCDVSGSMLIYARPFLAFLAGLMRADDASDAYLFHTRLVRITEALRDDDPLRALNRITLLADGFGGGSKIGAALDQFARGQARRFVNGRTAVMILSDGYDSAPAEVIDAALTRLKKRGCRVIWLNPLKGWRGYAPVAACMAAALPHLDVFTSASTLDDLAALDKELVRL